MFDTDITFGRNKTVYMAEPLTRFIYSLTSLWLWCERMKLQQKNCDLKVVYVQRARYGVILRLSVPVLLCQDRQVILSADRLIKDSECVMK